MMWDYIRNLQKENVASFSQSCLYNIPKMIYMFYLLSYENSEVSGNILIISLVKFSIGLFTRFFVVALVKVDRFLFAMLASFVHMVIIMSRSFFVVVMATIVITCVSRNCTYRRFPRDYVTWMLRQFSINRIFCCAFLLLTDYKINLEIIHLQHLCLIQKVTYND